MPVPKPVMIERLLPGHAGRGRPYGRKPMMAVCHIEVGDTDLYDYFLTLPSSGQYAADCTVWNKRDGTLVRLMNDTDTAWTNGWYAEPLNHQNPLVEYLWQAGIYTGDVSLTIEHQGYPWQGITQEQLESSARLIAWWFQEWDIPADRTHIVGHYEIGPHKGCPGALFPFDKLVQRVKDVIAMNDKVVLNGHTLQGAFLDFYNKHGGLLFMGYPVSDEFVAKDTGWKTMAFERYVVEIDPNSTPEWSVRGRLVGSEWYDRNKP